MKMTTKQKIAEIQRMTAGEMRREYIEVFGEETRSGNRQWMYRRLAWRLQALDEGGITNRARKRARELVRDQDIRVIPPAEMKLEPPRKSTDKTLDAPDFIINNRDPRLPIPGQVIPRKYKGTMHQVTVLANGFEYEGKVYRSLSAVARLITGSNWNGYHFFKLPSPRK